MRSVSGGNRGVEGGAVENRGGLVTCPNSTQFWAKGRQAALGKFGIVRVEPGVGVTQPPPPTHSQESQQSHKMYAASQIKKQELFKVPSLLFELETEDVGNSMGVFQTQIQTEIKQYLTPKTISELQITESIMNVIGDVVDAMSLPDLVVYLETKGIQVKLRNALGGTAGSECLRQLRHSFLVYSTEDGVDYIIDPTFKSQFEVAHPTTHYQAVLDSIPSLYVASEESLITLVHFICKQMEKSFLERGEIIPPWRSRSAVLSMWKPRRSTDLTPREISQDKNQTKIQEKKQNNNNNNNNFNNNDFFNNNTNNDKNDFFIPIGEEIYFPKESLVTGSGDSSRSILSEVLQGDSSQSSSPQGPDHNAWIQIPSVQTSQKGINNEGKGNNSMNIKNNINNNVPVANQKPLVSCLSAQLAAQN